jgi:NAD-dependent DNA ligase
MDIADVNKNCEQLISTGLIKDAADLYAIKREDLVEIGWLLVQKKPITFGLH